MRVAGASLARNESGLKVDTPKMRGWGEEFHTDTHASGATFTDIDDSTFLLFLGFRDHQNEQFAVVHFVAEAEKTYVGANHKSFADLANLAAFLTTAKRLQPDLVEDALAATCPCLEEFTHRLIMGSRAEVVNCPFGQVFLTGQAGFRTTQHTTQLVRGAGWP